MKYIYMIISILIIIGNGYAIAEDTPQLVHLRQQFEVNKTAALRPVIIQYRRSLQQLERQFKRERNQEAVDAVQTELLSLTQFLAGFKGKNYVSEERGLAGLNPVRNTYPFSIEEIGTKTYLRYWVSGDVGTDSYGEVILVAPNGSEDRVASWEPSDFDIPANQAKSYKYLNVKRVDITEYVKAKGTYNVVFRYKRGSIALAILRVEIETK